MSRGYSRNRSINSCSFDVMNTHFLQSMTRRRHQSHIQPMAAIIGSLRGTTPSPPQPSPSTNIRIRAISAALVPLTIAPFAAGTEHPLIDAVLCGTLLIHSHIGFQSIIIDYVPMKRVPRARKVFWWGLRAATLTVAVGLYEFETNDVGLTEGIKRIWHA